MIPLKTQYSLLINSIIFGAYLGITYDFLRFYRNNNYWFKVFTDIVFWVTQSIVASYFFYNISYGIIPIYLFIMFFVGFVSYYYFLHDFLTNKLLTITTNTTKFYRKTEKQRRFALGIDNYEKMIKFFKKIKLNKRKKSK
ncbi:spore cortex biosynthesis protein YabQ [Mycoplasmatota bacterium]|nr:spore cortex biosynthesis protein YabQ [Mycoplasmatota bacterium]